MREALAASDPDFVLTEAASNPEHLRERPGGPKRRGARALRRRGRRIVPYLAAGFFAAAFAATLFNALLGQKGRHSGPLLFARAAPPAPPKAPKATDAPAAQAPKRAPPAPETALERPSQELAVRKDAPAGAQDQISKILQETAAPPLPSPAAGSQHGASPPKAPVADKAVAHAQRALVKLGYVLKADGISGTATKKAIERYEREHGLAADGTLTPALVRRLGAEAGMATK